MVEDKVQKDNFQIPTLHRVVSRKPFATKVLRRFKSLHRKFAILVATQIAGVKLQLEVGFPIPNLRRFFGHRLLVDLFQQSEIEQPGLLLTQKG